MSERGPYLQFDCPLCQRPRLLHHYDMGSEKITCEKCEMEWPDEQAVVDWSVAEAEMKAARAVLDEIDRWNSEHAQDCEIRNADPSAWTTCPLCCYSRNLDDHIGYLTDGQLRAVIEKARSEEK